MYGQNILFVVSTRHPLWHMIIVHMS